MFSVDFFGVLAVIYDKKLYLILTIYNGNARQIYYVFTSTPGF